MNENGSNNKLNGIRQIVKFKEILQKWQSVTLRSRANSSPRGGSRAGSNPRSLPDRRAVAGSNPQLAPFDRRGVSASLRTHSDTRMLLVDNARSHSDRNVLVGESALSDSRESSPLSSRRGISPAISKRLTNVICDSDEDFCASPEPPSDVPEGYLAVYVGTELRRFIIPTSYLSHSLFKVLLEKAEEEFGFDHSGGLTIPCETETFKFLLQCMENHQKAHPDDTPAGAWKLEQ